MDCPDKKTTAETIQTLLRFSFFTFKTRGQYPSPAAVYRVRFQSVVLASNLAVWKSHCPWATTSREVCHMGPQPGPRHQIQIPDPRNIHTPYKVGWPVLTPWSRNPDPDPREHESRSWFQGAGIQPAVTRAGGVSTVGTVLANSTTTHPQCRIKKQQQQANKRKSTVPQQARQLSAVTQRNLDIKLHTASTWPPQQTGNSPIHTTLTLAIHTVTLRIRVQRSKLSRPWRHAETIFAAEPGTRAHHPGAPAACPSSRSRPLSHPQTRRHRHSRFWAHPLRTHPATCSTCRVRALRSGF